MAKRKVKTEEKPEKKKKKDIPQQEEAKDESSESTLPDYGGIPARDLKKNLGCG